MDKINVKAREKGVKIGVRPLYWGNMDGNIFVYSEYRNLEGLAILSKILDGKKMIVIGENKLN